MWTSGPRGAAVRPAPAAPQGGRPAGGPDDRARRDRPRRPVDRRVGCRVQQGHLGAPARGQGTGDDRVAAGSGVPRRRRVLRIPAPRHLTCCRPECASRAAGVRVAILELHGGGARRARPPTGAGGVNAAAAANGPYQARHAGRRTILMTNADGALASALDELAALGTEQDREQIAALRDRLDAARLRVLVAGEAKRGKSTLINALLGRAVLPAGVTPLTAVATTVRYGDDPHAEVRFADGHEEKQPLTALPDLVTERGNPGNRRHVAAVTVYLNAPVLADGVELVDTPGTGSVFAWDTAAAHEALETMDAAVFVLTADPPVSAAERDLYAKISGLAVATFTVLNKADHLDEAGLAEASEFTRQVLADADHPGMVYPMSARAALRGGDAGFTAFQTDFTAYLSSRREADLRASAIAQA